MFRAIRLCTYGFVAAFLVSSPLWAAERGLLFEVMVGQESSAAEVPASTRTSSSAASGLSSADSNRCAEASVFADEAALMLRSEPAKAEVLYGEAIRQCPESANLKLNQVVAIYGQGRVDEVVDFLKRLVQKDPDNVDAMRLLAFALVESGTDPARGRLLAETILASNPADMGAKRIVMLALTGGILSAPRVASTPAAETSSKDRSSGESGDADGPTVTALADIDIDIPVTGIENPDAIAVVIGNMDYEDKDIPAVEYAINDAESVKKYLINVLGYQEGNIIYLPNATKARFEATFGTKENYRDSRLYNYLKEGKSDIFIYYSGHGAPDLKTKDGYFVPVDADPQTISLTGYSLQQLYDNIAKIARERKSPDTFIVIDACFSGASEAGLLVKNASPITISVENPLLTMENTVVLTSSSGAEISSWYPEKNHSMFTYFFLKALREGAEKPDGEVTAEDIFSSLSDSANGLPYYARRLHNRIQTPQLTGDKDRVFIEGDGFNGALEGIL